MPQINQILSPDQPVLVERSKVLVVDDMPANLLAMSLLLENINVDVYQACCGNDALAMVLSHSFSLVLLDVQMPEMDGYEVATLIHSHPLTNHVPIIFLTANSRGKENRLKGYSAGAVDYLEKPIEEESLLAKVQLFKELDEKNRALEQLQRRAELLQRKTEATLGSIPDPLICVQGDKIVFLNKSAESLVKSFLCKQTCTSLKELFSFSPENLSQIQQIIRGAADIDDMHDESLEITFSVPKTSKSLTYEFRVAPLRGSKNAVDEVILIFHDVTQLVLMSEELSHQAFHDTLTQLPNRRSLEDVFKRAVSRKERNGVDFAVMLIDLDNFKRVNDSAGHCAGDEVLCEAARRIRACLRDIDTLSRIGGDEFCVIIEEVQSIDSLELPARRIVDSVSCPYEINQTEHKIGASIGVTSTLIDDERDLTSMLTDADLAMYEAKNGGKNQFFVFNSKMRIEMHNKLRLDQELISAIANSEFCLYYQPQVSIKNGKIIGLEALIRWNHPKKGLVGPLEFIPMLESTGMIKTVGMWVIEEACCQIAQWLSSGIEVPCISVNVSSQQFEQKELSEYIFTTMQRYDVKPEYLGIEITESLFMGLTMHVENNLKQIHEMGCKISMDDFGTGYSSLSYLLRFPIDVIKIDQSFVRGVLDNEKNQNMIRTIVSLGHDYNGMKVIAEGVETSSVLSLLKEIGCDYYQGYFYSKPLAAHIAEENLLEDASAKVVAHPHQNIRLLK